MKQLIHFILLFLLAVWSSGCQENPENRQLKDNISKLERLSQDIVNTSKAKLDQLRNTPVEELTDASLAEVKKLRQFEYQVTTFPTNERASEIQHRMSMLGKEGWDCFDIQRRVSAENREEFMVFCKRLPDTLLRYVPPNLLPLP